MFGLLHKLTKAMEGDGQECSGGHQGKLEEAKKRIECCSFLYRCQLQRGRDVRHEHSYAVVREELGV